MPTNSTPTVDNAKTTGIREVSVPTTGIEEVNAATTGILEVNTPTTGINEVNAQGASTHEKAAAMSTALPSQLAAKAPAGTVTFLVEKEFHTGQRLWHPVWQEVGDVISEENYRGMLLLVEKGKANEEYQTAQHAKTPMLLTVNFEKSGNRRLVCNLDRPR